MAKLPPNAVKRGGGGGDPVLAAKRELPRGNIWMSSPTWLNSPPSAVKRSGDNALAAKILAEHGSMHFMCPNFVIPVPYILYV